MDEVSPNAHRSDIDRIERLADTKGVEIDDVAVFEGTDEDGTSIVTFRIFETRTDSETDSVGVDVTKVPSMPGADQVFKRQITDALSELKKYRSGTDDTDVSDIEQPETSSDTQTRTESDHTTAQDQSHTAADCPGAQIDARLSEIESRLDDIEARLDEYDETVGAMQTLMGGSSDDMDP